MPNLCNILTQYSYVSNFKINYKKSGALNLTLQEATLYNTQNCCKFKWGTVALKYLGIQLIQTLKLIYKHNF